MTPDRWRQISRIFHEALARPPASRDAFIADAANGDEALASDVRSLIAQSAGDSLLDRAGAAPSGTTRTSEHIAFVRLGRFEVRGLLGAGGMGEVYRAHDPGLGRDVAVKILPAAFTTDADRLARFEREARVLAAISHPHIAAIYGVEEIPPLPGEGPGAARALVLELVEGETLADRLRRGPLPVDDAIEIARQIADALEAAHDKGIVHRDLKPANVKIRPDGLVKVLDFGLAKVDTPAGEDLATDRAPLGQTSAGIVLGTPSYMSPEQARGVAVDRRTDVWAFGCVLYELLSGRRAFTGDTAADIIGQLLHRDPDWDSLPADTPSSVRRLLRRCLERNAKLRLRDIGDARLELMEREHEPPVRAAKAQGERVVMWAAVAVSLALAAVSASLWLRPQPAPQVVEFSMDAGEALAIAGPFLPSPDGRRLVFAAKALSGEVSLWARRLESTAAERLAGTDGAAGPFWSADGQFIGFSANGAMRRVPAAGGPVQRIVDLAPMTFGAAWNRDHVILFTPSNRAPLHRVSAGGGPSEPLTTLNAARRENSHRWPQFLPDGRHFLFTARSDLPEHTGVYVASLDSPASPKWLMAAASKAEYLSSGHLLFMRDNTLLAQRFDTRTFALAGEPVAIAGEIIVESASTSAMFAASADGRVVTYNTAAPQRLVWRDRLGAEVGGPNVRGSFAQLRLSPDGSRAAVVMPDPSNGNRDLWTIALSTGAFTRLTSHAASDWFPVWSADGKELVFASDRDATPSFYRVAATGGNPRLVYRAATSETVFPTDWSPDGRALLFHSYPRGNVSTLPLAAAASPAVVVDSPFTDWVASFAPDGRRIAYVSDESGASEIYVKPVSGNGKQRVSISGGIQPRWRRDGRELFFIDESGTLHGAALTAGTFEPPRPLFSSCREGNAAPFMYLYDVSADGSRFLWICDGGDYRKATVLVNGLAALLP